MVKRNPVQNFMRGLIRLVIFAPLWIVAWKVFFPGAFKLNAFTFYLGLCTIAIFWVANLFAKMVHVLPQWQRMVLLRLGKSVGARGPGFFLIPPFIYSVARIVDIRIDLDG